MTEITYYRWSAALPIVVPLIAYVIAWRTTPSRGVLEGTVTLVVLSGAVAGPAYVPFISVLLWWLRKKPATSYRVASFVAPILFTPVFVLYLLLLGYFMPSPEPFVENVVFYLSYLLGVGYAYVALVHLLRLVLSSCGWVNGSELTAV